MQLSLATDWRAAPEAEISAEGEPRWIQDEATLLWVCDLRNPWPLEVWLVPFS